MKIGLRVPGACGKEMPLSEFAHWCAGDGFDSMDLGGADPARIQAVHEAGLTLGTLDLAGTRDLLHADEAVRQKGIEAGLASVNAIADVGGSKAFCVFFPQDATQSRRDSFAYWKASFPPVAAQAEKRGVRIAVEGWPGPGNSALGVTPETLRLMFEAVPTDAFGINYDPSHLVRVGVDYQRFLNEFAGRVIHAHGKDTRLNADGVYEFGNIGTTLAPAPDFGAGDWRYCIPGEGDVDWSWVCGRLHQAGFDGVIAIELEDFRYNGTVAGEKQGLNRARAHLSQFV